MKYEWKKSEKNLYGAKQTPRLVEVPAQKFITIKGAGNPNEEDFSARVSALYSLAYSIKMLYKTLMKDDAEGKIMGFTVYPLEGIWQKAQGEELDKSKLKYTIMIKQPDFITREIFDNAIEKVRKKKSSDLYDEIVFKSIEDGKSVQILHIGSYDSEPESFVKMDAFIKESGLVRSGGLHREIYLNSKDRVTEDKLKTILRYCVK
ncbi:GyrI-like domain-containing protein [Campylobacter sp.]|uniref:GyrI-like domain-containing protein n=1 Tax=Campylobacter sp. TaxID=205 RepID=UPI002704B7C3|nr:GyrI-like domain-containing protein [Campylobacter sp.]